MYSIIPLAGPDFYSAQHGIRPLFPVEGVPLVVKALASRPWICSGEVPEEKLIFVTRVGPGQAEFADFVRTRYPSAQLLVLPKRTGGALLSACAGSTVITDFDEPLVVDLIDILFEMPGYNNISSMFSNDSKIGGILPHFTSSDPCYSYLEIINAKVVRTVEKQVISSAASAGTYFFRNLEIFLRSVCASLKAFPAHTVNNILFMCPAYNWLLQEGLDVIPIPVAKVNSVSKIFHKN